jgi:hypothetical protein|tara:strand:+ start:299 stop:544 length:246 start_codon:yes stop_codon:yes gene_type:complete
MEDYKMNLAVRRIAEEKAADIIRVSILDNHKGTTTVAINDDWDLEVDYENNKYIATAYFIDEYKGKRFTNTEKYVVIKCES